MTNARKRVLQMLADGRITVDEADELLLALSGSADGERAGGGAARGRGPGRWPEIEFDIEGLGERIHQTVMRGLERVEQELRELDRRMRREDWPRHWKMGGRGAWRSRDTEDREAEAPGADAGRPSTDSGEKPQ
jgi:hypothetical protein